VVLATVMFLVMSQSAKAGLESLVYENVDRNQMADGTFEGEADAGMVYVRVAVTIQDHAITHIDILEHENGRGAAAEAITDTMKAANSYDVDVVSGATLSSEAFRSAVSKALKASCDAYQS
jgi:uncharacterized protein with FMN-binding domain